LNRIGLCKLPSHEPPIRSLEQLVNTLKCEQLLPSNMSTCPQS
jgi:hypothetical protein